MLFWLLAQLASVMIKSLQDENIEIWWLTDKLANRRK